MLIAYAAILNQGNPLFPDYIIATLLQNVRLFRVVLEILILFNLKYETIHFIFIHFNLISW